MNVATVICVLLLFAASGCLCAAPIPVVIDTDIGTDIDDSWALAVALRSPNIDVKMVLTATHNTVARAQIVAKYLEAVGRTDIPIGVGIEQDKGDAPLFGWAASTSLDEYPGMVYADGVNQLIEIIKSSPQVVTIVAIAPAGNIAALLQRYPDAKAKVRIVAMSGSVYRGYGNSSTPDREYNVLDNIPASQAMYATQWAEPMVSTPLDTCGVAQLTHDTYRQFLTASNPIAAVLLQCYTYWSNSQPASSHNPGQASTILYDAVAMFLTVAWDESIAPLTVVNMTVTSDGYTRPSATGLPVREALNWVPPNGLQAFSNWLVTRLGDK